MAAALLASLAAAPAAAQTLAGGVGSCRPRSPRFVSRPDLQPVAYCVQVQPARPGREGILVAPKARPGGQQGLWMLAANGQLAWYVRRSGFVRDAKVVTYRGRTRLAFYQDGGDRASSYVLMDHRYRVVRRIRAGRGARLDMHELQLTPSGTAYVWATRTERDPVSGRTVLDDLIQELDVDTGRVRFEWSALAHVPTSASYKLPPAGERPWDYFHGNSIEPPTAADPTLIVSARNTSSVYGIDRATGAVTWILGGRQDSSGLLARWPQWRFCAQHDARRLPDGELSVFDNGGVGKALDRVGCPVHPARVERFRVAPQTTAPASAIDSGPSSDGGGGILPRGLGSARTLATGDTLVSWGSSARLTAVSPSGAVDLAVRFAHPTYRAVPARWSGRPGRPPAMAARPAGAGALDVWASWNGATHVRAWQVLAGRRRDGLRPAGGRVPWAGLETSVRVHAPGARFAAVRALDGAGRRLARSRAVPIR